MSKIDTKAIGILEGILERESTLLRGCDSETEYFNRYFSVTIPLIRAQALIAPLLKVWDPETDEGELVKTAAKEIVYFLRAQWRDAKGDVERRRVIRKIIQLARADINWGKCLAYQVRPLIKGLCSGDVAVLLPSFNLLSTQESIFDYEVASGADPKLLWQSLKMVEVCWPRRMILARSIRWEKPRGTAEAVAIKAYSDNKEFRICAVAEELRCLERTNVPRKYFTRDRFQRIFDRLRLEIMNRLHVADTAIPKKQPEKTEQRKKSKAFTAIKNYVLQKWTKDPIITQEKWLRLIHKAHKDGVLKVKSLPSDRTILKYLREIDPLPPDQRKRRPKA